MNKKIAIIMVIIMILSIVTSVGFSSSANTDVIGYETVSEYPEEIDTILSGNYYLSGQLVSGGDSLALKMATSLQGYEVAFRIPDTSLDFSFFQYRKVEYLKLSSGTKKNYVDISEYGIGFDYIGIMLPLITLKSGNYDEAVCVNIVYDGIEYDVYLFRSLIDSSAVMFYVTDGNVVQITMTDKYDDTSSIIVDEITGEIPAGMLTLKGFSETSITFVPYLYPEFLDWDSSHGIGSSKPVEITTLPPVEIPEEITDEIASDIPETEDAATELVTEEITAVETTAAEAETLPSGIVPPVTVPPVTEEPTTVVLPDEPIILGDIDGDGYLTSADARLALRLSAKLENGTSEQFLAADVNADDKISATDGRLILSASAMLGTIENGAPVRTYLDEERNNEVKIKADIPLYREGDEFTLTICAKNMCGAENGNVFLTYDTSVLEFINAEKSDDSECELVFTDEYEDGKIAIAFVCKESAMSDSAFADITFRALSEAETKIEYVIGTWNGTSAPEDGFFVLAAYEEPTTEVVTKEPETESVSNESSDSSTESEVEAVRTTKAPETETTPEKESDTTELVTQVPSTEKLPDVQEEKETVTKVPETEESSTVTPTTESTTAEATTEVLTTEPVVETTTEPETSTEIVTVAPEEKPVVKTTAVVIPEINKADVDGNGRITAADARLALRISAKLEKGTSAQLLTADVNKDGKITAADARTILRVSARLEKL